VLPEAAARSISGLRNLRSLSLEAEPEEDAVSVLATFPAFTELVVTRPFTRTGATRLKELKNLRRLSLKGELGGYEDADVARVRDLTSLAELDLSRQRVSDAGLSHLKRLANLEALDLRETRVTDAGLVHLEGLSKLRHLSVGKTGVTKKGIEGLVKKLPQLQVQAD
jgi:hypothetical protein